MTAAGGGDFIAEVSEYCRNCTKYCGCLMKKSRSRPRWRQYRHCEKKLVRLLFDFAPYYRRWQRDGRWMWSTGCDGRTLLITLVVSDTTVALCWQQLWSDAESNGKPYIVLYTVFRKKHPPRGLPPLGHIWDVMLVWRKGNINKNCLCVTLLHCILPVLRHLSLIMTLITIYVFI